MWKSLYVLIQYIGGLTSEREESSFCRRVSLSDCSLVIVGMLHPPGTPPSLHTTLTSPVARCKPTIQEMLVSSSSFSESRKN